MTKKHTIIISKDFKGDKAYFDDTSLIMAKIQNVFPEIIINTKDPRQKKAAEVAEILGKDHIVVKSLEKNIQTYGSTYLFLIPNSFEPIEGFLDKFNLRFICSEQISKGLYNKILSFFDSINVEPEVYREEVN